MSHLHYGNDSMCSKVSADRLFLYIYTLQSDTLFVCHVVA